MNFLKLLLGGVLVSSSLLANDYYPDNEEGMHCSCEILHYCVQLGFYEKKVNLEKAKTWLKNDKSIFLLTEEEIQIKKKLYYRLIAHSNKYYIDTKEAQNLLKTINKKYKKQFPKAFVIKRYIMD